MSFTFIDCRKLGVKTVTGPHHGCDSQVCWLDFRKDYPFDFYLLWGIEHDGDVENELKRYTVQSHLKFSDEEHINDESQMKLRKSLADCIIKTNDYLSKSLEEDRYPLVAERPTEEYALDSAIKLLNQFLKFNSSYESDEMGGSDILN